MLPHKFEFINSWRQNVGIQMYCYNMLFRMLLNQQHVFYANTQSYFRKRTFFAVRQVPWGIIYSTKLHLERKHQNKHIQWLVMGLDNKKNFTY